MVPATVWTLRVIRLWPPTLQEKLLAHDQGTAKWIYQALLYTIGSYHISLSSASYIFQDFLLTAFVSFTGIFKTVMRIRCLEDAGNIFIMENKITSLPVLFPLSCSLPVFFQLKCSPSATEI